MSRIILPKFPKVLLRKLPHYYLKKKKRNGYHLKICPDFFRLGDGGAIRMIPDGPENSEKSGPPLARARHLCDSRSVRFLLGLLLAAGVGRAASVEDLARAAQVVIRGKVEAKSIQRDAAGQIFTQTKIAVTEVWKGDPKQPLLPVISGDGILGEIKAGTLGDVPEVSYALGEEVVVFLVWNDRHEALTLEMANGKFRVAGGAAENRLGKFALAELKRRVAQNGNGK
jgi:hypothetical protein